MSRILSIGIVSVLFIFMSTVAVASTTMQASDLEKVEKKQIQSASERETMEQVAVTLASYEFAAAKLVDLVNENRMRESIDRQAGELINLSESVLDWGRFRLAQCDAYLATSLELKDQLQSISHDALEKNYHHDGLLPQAPPCRALLRCTTRVLIAAMTKGASQTPKSGSWVALLTSGCRSLLTALSMHRA